MPFIITDDLKGFYYRGLERWGDENGFLTDTCLSAQDRFVAYLEYFQIPVGISGTAGTAGSAGRAGSAGASGSAG